jgi:hypothetical protein
MNVVRKSSLLDTNSLLYRVGAAYAMFCTRVDAVEISKSLGWIRPKEY